MTDGGGSDGARPQRIFLGTHEIARQLHDLGGGLRELGHTVTTVVGRTHPLYSDLRYDYVIDRAPRNAVPTSWQDRITHLGRRIRLTAARKPIPSWIREHDVFVFLWGSSMLPGNRDYPILRRLGKTVITIFLGSDIRHWSAAAQFRHSLGLGTYDGYREGRCLNNAVQTLRMAELYANVSYLQPSYAELAIAPYMHMYLAINRSLYPFTIPRRETPVVVHAPSRRSLKGTEHILAVANQLRAEGMDFELRVLEGLPNSTVLHHLADADIVVDEINEAHYGMLGLEAMASGCAVLGGNRPDLVPLPGDSPVVHVTPATLGAQLRRVLVDRDHRVRLAEEGRDFLTKHHDHITVARNLLQGPTRAALGTFDYTPTWFVERYTLPAGHALDRRNRTLTASLVLRAGLADVLPNLQARGLASRRPWM